MAKDNKPNSNNFKVSPWLVYTAILLIFLTISFLTGGSSFQEPAQLKSSDVTKGNASNGNSETSKPTASYCGINCFKVTTQVQGYPLNVEMVRQGFSDWQIVKVKLPL